MFKQRFVGKIKSKMQFYTKRSVISSAVVKERLLWKNDMLQEKLDDQKHDKHP